MLAERKRRGNKKNKLEEIQKPRGYERGLEADRIVGVTDTAGTLQFLIKWVNCDEFDLLPASEINEKSPDIVIQYYEDRSTILKKCDQRRLITEKFELDLIDHPLPELPVSEDEDDAVIEATNEIELVADESEKLQESTTVATAATTEALPESVEAAATSVDAELPILNYSISMPDQDPNNVQIQVDIGHIVEPSKSEDVEMVAHY